MTIIGSLRSFYHRWQDSRRLKRELAEFSQTFERKLAARRVLRPQWQQRARKGVETKRRRGTA